MAPTARGRSQSPPYQSPSPPQQDIPIASTSGPETTRRGKRWSSEEEQEVLAVTARFLGAGKTSDWNRVKAELQGPAKTRNLTAIKSKYKLLVPQANKKKKQARELVRDLSVSSIETSSQDEDSQETLSNVGSPPLNSPSLNLPINPGSPLLSPPVAPKSLRMHSISTVPIAPFQARPPSPIDWTIAEDAALLSTLYLPSQSVKSWEDVRNVTIRVFDIAEGGRFDKTIEQCAERYYLALKELRIEGQDCASETIQAILYTNFHREQIARYAQSSLPMPTTLPLQTSQAFAPPSRTSTPVFPAPQMNHPTYVAPRPLLTHDLASRRHSNNERLLSEALIEGSHAYRQSQSSSSIPRNFPTQNQSQLQPSAFAYHEHIPKHHLPAQPLESKPSFLPQQLSFVESYENSSQTQQKSILLPFSPISPEVYRESWTNRRVSPSSTVDLDVHSATDTPETTITRPSPRSKSRDESWSPGPSEEANIVERGTRRGRKRGSSAVSYVEVTELSDDDEQYRDVSYTKKSKME